MKPNVYIFIQHVPENRNESHGWGIRNANKNQYLPQTVDSYNRYRCAEEFLLLKLLVTEIKSDEWKFPKRSLTKRSICMSESRDRRNCFSVQRKEVAEDWPISEKMKIWCWSGSIV